MVACTGKGYGCYDKNQNAKQQIFLTAYECSAGAFQPGADDDVSRAGGGRRRDHDFPGYGLCQ